MVEFISAKQSESQQLVLIVGPELEALIPTLTDPIPCVPQGTSDARMTDIDTRGAASIHCKGLVERITVPENGMPGLYRGRVTGYAIPSCSVLVPMFIDADGEDKPATGVRSFRYMSAKNFVKSNKVDPRFKRQVEFVIKMMKAERAL